MPLQLSLSGYSGLRDIGVEWRRCMPIEKYSMASLRMCLESAPAPPARAGQIASTVAQYRQFPASDDMSLPVYSIKTRRARATSGSLPAGAVGS